MSKKKTDQPAPEVSSAAAEVERDETESQLQELQAELEAIQEREKRALADYQNLVRRHRQERLQLAHYANQELLSALLQPLEHLNLAAKQIEDEGLAMVVKDLWQVLTNEGLEELDPLGEEFDEKIMEAVNPDPRSKKAKATNAASDDQDQAAQKEPPLVVAEVIKPGYKLHDRLLQPAKVVVKLAA